MITIKKQKVTKYLKNITAQKLLKHASKNISFCELNFKYKNNFKDIQIKNLENTHTICFEEGCSYIISNKDNKIAPINSNTAIEFCKNISDKKSTIIAINSINNFYNDE